jgi:hypothetical protein
MSSVGWVSGSKQTINLSQNIARRDWMGMAAGGRLFAAAQRPESAAVAAMALRQAVAVPATIAQRKAPMNAFHIPAASRPLCTHEMRNL